MDVQTNDAAPGRSGNVAVPDWMLKRRARAAQAGPGVDVECQAIPASAASRSTTTVVSPQSQSELESASELPDSKLSPFTTEALASIPDVASLKSDALRAQSIRIAIKAESDPVRPVVPWYANFRQRWLGGKEQKSFLISLVVHLVCGLPLSLVVFHPDLANMGISTIMSEQGDDVGGDPLDDSTVFKIDPAGGQSSEALDTFLTSTGVSSTVGPSSLAVPEDLGGINLGEGDGAGDGVGSGVNVGGYKMPAGGKAVNKGSFTAWTVPLDPEPGEDYEIIIQVKYKKRDQKVPPGDISGSIIDTNNWKMMISRHTSRIIPEANQVVVKVPGAAAHVRDTIRIYSALLKENQSLEIVF